MAQLTQAQSAKIRGLLEERYKELVARVRDELARSDEEQVAALANRVRDAGDESVVDLVDTLGAAIVDRQLGELREIERARKRLEAGEINTCVECGDEIGFQRLAASPTAVRCVRCQEHYEKTHAGTGNSRL
ncbi:MAG TPA: TraR/DksA family transcriptional regulator [Pelomicrobium sp.]|nr:TraR/DksA family transcriptional regulator [Pelomicrobium sp.]